MKNKKEIAFNKLFFLFVILGVISLAVGFVVTGEEISAFGIGCIIVGLVFLTGGSIMAPCCYCFDSDGVTCYYVFLPKERYLWKNIRNICVKRDGYSESEILEMIFSYVFEIKGKAEGKQHFYMQGQISRSFRTKRLIEKYWHKGISGLKSKKK